MDVDRNLTTLQDFIVGRLSDDELRAFEDRLVRDPELVRELEQSLRMREGLQELRAQGYFRKAAFRTRIFRIWVPALAAAAVAGLALFLWLSRVTGSSLILMASPELRTAADVRPLITALFTFVSVRGGSTPDLDLPSAGLIEFRAAPNAPETHQRYRVTLVRRQEVGREEPVAELGSLALDKDGYVHCYADASRLTEGSYILRMQPGNDTSGTAEVFPFNLRAAVTESSR